MTAAAFPWRAWLLGWMAVAALCGLLVLWVDVPLARALIALDPATDTWMRRITELGDAKYYLVGTALAYLAFRLAGRGPSPEARRRQWLRRAWASLFLFAGVAVSGLAADVVKLVAGRARPKLLLADPPVTGFHLFDGLHSGLQSFPSGHAATVGAVAAVLGLLSPRLGLLMLPVAAAVGTSRLALKAHYLSDVVAGAFLGLFVAFLLAPPFRRRLAALSNRHASSPTETSLPFGTGIP